MTTIVINEKTEDGRSLMNVIRALWKSSNAVVSIDGDEVGTFEHVPGMPHTPEELRASVRRSEEQYAQGRTATVEQLRAKHPRI